MFEPRGGPNEGRPSGEGVVLLPVRGLPAPLRLSAAEYQDSPWARLAEQGPLPPERLRSLAREMSEVDLSNEPAVLRIGEDIQDARGESFLRTMVEAFAELQPGEQRMVLAYASTTELLQPDCRSLLFLGCLWQEAQSHSSPEHREELTTALARCVGKCLTQIEVRHALGLITADDPFAGIESQLVDIAIANSHLRRAITWVCTEWRARIEEERLGPMHWAHAIEYARPNPDFTSSRPADLLREITATRDYFRQVARFAAILKPGDRSAPWYHPAAAIQALATPGTTLDIRNLPITAPHQEGTLYLIGALLAGGTPVHWQMTSTHSLVREMYEVCAAANNRLSLARCHELTCAYLQSNGAMALNDFFGIRAASGPGPQLLRSLRALREASAGTLTFSCLSPLPGSLRAGDDLVSIGAPSEVPTHRVCFEAAREGDPQVNPMITSIHAVREAAHLIAGSLGTGPFGLCAVPRPVIEALYAEFSAAGGKLPRDPLLAQLGRFFLSHEPHADLVLFLTSREDGNPAVEEQTLDADTLAGARRQGGG